MSITSLALRCFPALAAFSVFTQSYAHADSPYETRFFRSSQFDSHIHNLREPGLSRSLPLHFSFSLPGERKVKGYFHKLASTQAEAKTGATMHLQGVLQSPRYRSNRSFPRWVSATVHYDKSDVLVDMTFVRVSRAGVVRYFKVKKRLGEAKARVIRAPEYILADRICAHHKDSYLGGSTQSSLSASPGLALPRATLKQVELGLEADHSFVAALGSASNASSQINSIVNTTTTAYERDLALTLSMKTKRLETNQSVYPNTLSAAEDLLDKFQNYLTNRNHLGAADAYMLFSGKDFDGNTIGLATLGMKYPANAISGCSSGLVGICGCYASGTVQHINESVDWVIFAHELGHILGSQHDEDVGCSAPASGIMTTQLGNSIPSAFSTCSISAISNHTATYGSCLADASSGGGGSSGGSGSVPSPGGGGTGGTDGSGNDGGSSDNDGGSDSGGDGDGSTSFPGGSNGSGLPVAPELTFAAELIARSKIEGQVTLASLLDECVLEFRAAPTRRKLHRGEIVGVFAPTSTSVAFSVEFVSRLKSTKTSKQVGKASRNFMYLGVLHNCGAQYQTRLSASVLRFDATAIAAQKQEPLRRWYRSFSNNLLLSSN